ncbi:MAG: zinc ribbon domain-containing protein [Lachnospiraceae bacterium]|nr:zinc ribbon domain-containing protein [Lachnospiraceae bacterium]
MKCKKCGNEFQEGLFCPQCGTKFELDLCEENKNNISMEKIGAILFLVIIIATTVFIVKNTTQSNREVYNVTVSISYGKQKGLFYNDDAILYIDGEKIGVIEYGTSKMEYSLQLKDGKHEAVLKSDTTWRKNKSNKVKFNIDKYTSVINFEISQSSLTGLKLKVNK